MASVAYNAKLKLLFLDDRLLGSLCRIFMIFDLGLFLLSFPPNPWSDSGVGRERESVGWDPSKP